MIDKIKFFESLDYSLQYNLVDIFFSYDKDHDQIGDIIDIDFDFENKQMKVVHSDFDVLLLDMNIFIEKVFKYSEYTYWDWKKSYEDQKKHCEKMLSDLEILYTLVK